MDLRKVNNIVETTLPLRHGRVPMLRNGQCEPEIRGHYRNAELIDFQPLITLMGTDSTDPAANAIQPFAGWFDGADVTEVHFRVEVLEADKADLYLESSPTVDADVDQWTPVRVWHDPMGLPVFEIVVAVSSSGRDDYGYEFSRYIRWRVARRTSGGNWKICLRMKAIVGTSFTQWPEKPRVV